MDCHHFRRLGFLKAGCTMQLDICWRTLHC
jgi:hypothetical protein